MPLGGRVGVGSGELGRNRMAFAALLLLILWVPWPLGSNRAWSWAILELGCFLPLGWCCVAYVLRPSALPAALRAQKGTIAVLCLWLLYQVGQFVPWPPTVIALLSPGTADFRPALSSNALSEWRPVSLAPSASVVEALKNAAYVCGYILILWLVDSRKRLILLLEIMLMGATLNAIYGILVHLLPIDAGLWDPAPDRAWMAGSYVNRNHFAGLLELAIPAGIGLVMANSRRIRTGQGWQARTAALLDFALGPNGRLAFCLLVLIAALMLSGSRGGALAVLGGVGLAFALSINRQAMRRGNLRAAAVVVLAITGAVSWFGTGLIGERFSAFGISSNRLEVARAAWSMTELAPAIGIGGGSFRWVFPTFKDEEFGGKSTGDFYAHAHNEYLELLIEHGIVGASLLAAAVLLVLWTTIKALGRRRDALARGAAFASLAGVSALAMHGLVDFNFHIPANAMLWFVLLAVGPVAASIESRTAGPRRPITRPGPVRMRTVGTP